MSLHNFKMDDVSDGNDIDERSVMILSIIVFQVGAWVDYYSTASGAEFMHQGKVVYSDNVSIQGTWHPHVHTDPSVATATFPNKELGRARNVPPSASDHLLQLNASSQ